MLNVNNIVNQLTDRTVTDWVSDSSMSKLVHGKLTHVVRSEKGLRLILNTGKEVSWRMTQEIVGKVVAKLKEVEAIVDAMADIADEEWASLSKGYPQI